MKQFDFMKDPDNKGADSITVEHTPKRKLDLFPRIICLLVALGIWIYMVNMNDTDATETITLRIELTGVDTLEGEGMMVYGFDERTVTVTVKGTNRDLKQFDESGYKATVDVIGITEAKVNNLPITIKPPANTSITVESLTPGNVLVISDFIEIKTIENIRIAFGSVGDKSFTGEASVASLDIKGPREIVSNIVDVEFKIDGDIKDGQEITGFSAVKFYDINNEEVDVKGAVTVLTKEISVTVTEETSSSESAESTEETE